MKQLVLLLTASLLALLGAVWGAVSAWPETAPVAIGFHGTIALILGILGILGVGGGLMTLVFFSSRHRFDETATTTPTETPPETQQATTDRERARNDG